jgi:predicted nuclease of predicted toxin-antitoxin system
LDANLSYKVGQALALIDLPVLHVWDAIPSSRGSVKGQVQASDQEIANWCALAEYVLVTTDEDFRGRWVRSGLLQAQNVEVVVFTKDIKGLRNQHARVTRHLPYWEEELSRQPFGFRVWEQGPDNRPVMRSGQRRRKRARTFPAAVGARRSDRG